MPTLCRMGAAAIGASLFVAAALAPAAGAGGTVLLAQAGGGYDPMQPPQKAAPPDGAAAVPLNPELGNLPDTPGVEDTFYLCTACHSAAIIKQQHISPERWDYLWTWMVEEQGMPEQDAETKAKILSYLKRHFTWEAWEADDETPDVP